MISEQKDLLAAARAGDREACQEIIRTNDRLIWSIVQRYSGRGVELEDLFQLGCIGFLKAIQGFDPAYGTCFSTYAVPKIAGEIRRFLRDDGAVKVSRSIKEQAGKLYTVRERLRAALGREPTVSELAEETGMEIEEIASIETATAQVASLQAETGEGLTLESALGDTGMEESLVEQIALRDAIASLPEREQMVIILRYYRGFTQERTARVVGVSQVQISRIERKAVQHLREKLA
ncbi:MAG: sigma-70 family RNA polymerase sigma factor [Candidatus Onthomonas sp.]|nr:sigma-70 family RNA polymerase sigma factor [Candidatus Onthomonas sp.]